ncbi:hypothetical protein H4R19_003723 [Coemansia spiralis]|nr:hypothetical protein H4R19_003723 [Coemansia spiralis]
MRYSKVLTAQNAQMFAGGALLAAAAGYLWIQSRDEHGAELQQRLSQVQQNMYWSMALAQRDGLHPESDTSGQRWRRRRRRQAQTLHDLGTWWNGRVSALGSWAARPGYLTERAHQAQSAAGEGAAVGWRGATAAAGDGGRWAADQIAAAVHWEAATARIAAAWSEERAKWQRAHAHAVAAVHPRYAPGALAGTSSQYPLAASS